MVNIELTQYLYDHHFQVFHDYLRDIIIDMVRKQIKEDDQKFLTYDLLFSIQMLLVYVEYKTFKITVRDLSSILEIEIKFKDRDIKYLIDINKI